MLRATYIPKDTVLSGLSLKLPAYDLQTIRKRSKNDKIQWNAIWQFTLVLFFRLAHQFMHSHRRCFLFCPILTLQEDAMYSCSILVKRSSRCRCTTQAAFFSWATRWVVNPNLLKTIKGVFMRTADGVKPISVLKLVFFLLMSCRSPEICIYRCTKKLFNSFFPLDAMRFFTSFKGVPVIQLTPFWRFSMK